jgi:hypothetical protein
MPLVSLSLVAALTVLEARSPRIEQALVTVVSEPQGGMQHRIGLVLDAEGGIAQIVRRSERGESVASAADLIRGRVALAPLDAVLVSCPRCEVARGGRLVLEYLHNGLTGRYASRTFRLERGGDAFRLTTERGEPIRYLRLRTRRFLGALVGIDDVVAE